LVAGKNLFQALLVNVAFGFERVHLITESEIRRHINGITHELLLRLDGLIRISQLGSIDCAGN
jgi:hypothetical protein